MELEYSTLIMTWVNLFIILAIISFIIVAIVKIIKRLSSSKNTNDLILKQLKEISSKLDKKN